MWTEHDKIELSDCFHRRPTCLTFHNVGVTVDKSKILLSVPGVKVNSDLTLLNCNLLKGVTYIPQTTDFNFIL